MVEATAARQTACVPRAPMERGKESLEQYLERTTMFDYTLFHLGNILSAAIYISLLMNIEICVDAILMYLDKCTFLISY